MQPLTVLLALVISPYAAPLAPQTTGVLPAPASHLGFNPGADRRLANWDELVAYYDKAPQPSRCVSPNALGQTTGGNRALRLPANYRGQTIATWSLLSNAMQR